MPASPVAEPSEHEQRKVLVTEHALKEQIKARTERRKKDATSTPPNTAKAASKTDAKADRIQLSSKAQKGTRKGEKEVDLDALRDEMKQFARRQVVSALTAIAAAESAKSKHKHHHKHNKDDTDNDDQPQQQQQQQQQPAEESS